MTTRYLCFGDQAGADAARREQQREDGHSALIRAYGGSRGAPSYWRIVKGALLVSETIGALRLVMRTRASAVDGPVTVQDWRPSLLVLDQRVVHVAPPFLESSIRTLPLTPASPIPLFPMAAADPATAVPCQCTGP